MFSALWLRVSRYLPVAWIGSQPIDRLEALRRIQASQPDSPEMAIKVGTRTLYANADRDKTGDADILGLVVKREQERARQAGNVVQMRIGRVK